MWYIPEAAEMQADVLLSYASLKRGLWALRMGAFAKLANPKKKKLKHLDPKPAVLQAIAQKLANHQKVYDSEIRSALEAAGFNNRA